MPGRETGGTRVGSPDCVRLKGVRVYKAPSIPSHEKMSILIRQLIPERSAATSSSKVDCTQERDDHCWVPFSLILLILYGWCRCNLTPCVQVAHCWIFTALFSQEHGKCGGPNSTPGSTTAVRPSASTRRAAQPGRRATNLVQLLQLASTYHQPVAKYQPTVASASRGPRILVPLTPTGTSKFLR